MLLSTYILYINVKRDTSLRQRQGPSGESSMRWTPGRDSNGIVVGCIHGVLGFWVVDGGGRPAPAGSESHVEGGKGGTGGVYTIRRRSIMGSKKIPLRPGKVSRFPMY